LPRIAVSELTAHGHDGVPRGSGGGQAARALSRFRAGGLPAGGGVVLCDYHEVTEDEVVAGVARLAAAGEYQDFRYQLLGPEPEPVRMLPDGRPDPADLRRWLREWPKSKLFERGTPEYVAARDAGVLEPLTPLEPATPEAVAEAEEEIGYPLPSLLRRLYLEVGNGGFGPGQGIPGVRGGADVGWDWPDITAFHRAAQADERWKAWPWLVPLFDWGCTIMSLIDCRDADGRMWAWEEGELISLPHRQTLADWLGLWLLSRLTPPEGTGPGIVPGSRA
jgi:hypothetical protein